MPQPCSQPLSANPFESYRDPETGQWKVRYPTGQLPEMTQPLSQPKPLPQSVLVEKIKRTPKLRQWKESSQTRVA